MAAGIDFFTDRSFPLLNFPCFLKCGYRTGDFAVDQNRDFVAEYLAIGQLNDLAQLFVASQ